MSSNDISIKSEELRKKNNEICLCKAGNFSKTGFWHYSSIDNINKILKTKSFVLGSLNNVNDNNEKRICGKKDIFLHTLCFCNSDSEKIPMWYLYSGILGKGASVGITPLNMTSLIKNIKTKVCAYDIFEKKEICELKKCEYELQYGWTFYRKTSEKNKIKYKNKWYEITEGADVFENKNYFVKDYPWEYEKEFRIIIENKSKKPYNHLKINIPDDVYENLKIRLAPELSEDEINEVLHKDGFEELLSKKLIKSDLQISMGILNKNKKELQTYLKNAECDDEVKRYICKIIKDTSCDMHCKSGE